MGEPHRKFSQPLKQLLQDCMVATCSEFDTPDDDVVTDSCNHVSKTALEFIYIVPSGDKFREINLDKQQTHEAQQRAWLLQWRYIDSLSLVVTIWIGLQLLHSASCAAFLWCLRPFYCCLHHSTMVPQLSPEQKWHRESHEQKWHPVGTWHWGLTSIEWRGARGAASCTEEGFDMRKCYISLMHCWIRSERDKIRLYVEFEVIWMVYFEGSRSYRNCQCHVAQ